MHFFYPSGLHLVIVSPGVSELWLAESSVGSMSSLEMVYDDVDSKFTTDLEVLASQFYAKYEPQQVLGRCVAALTTYISDPHLLMVRPTTILLLY